MLTVTMRTKRTPRTPRTKGAVPFVASLAAVVATSGLLGAAGFAFPGVAGATKTPGSRSVTITPATSEFAARPSISQHTVVSTRTWTHTLFDTGAPIAESSPTVANLSGGPAVVVGDRSGKLYAFNLATGNPVPGWPVTVPGAAPIDSTPSVARLGGNTLDSVFIGSGNAADPSVGGYQGFGPGGNLLWYTRVSDPPMDASPAQAVQASLSVGNLQGVTSVAAGSLDQEGYALNAANGSPLTGWPFFDSDSVFSTAAIADLYGTGHNDIVEGGAQTAGYAYGQTYTSGGHVRILNSSGALVCSYNTTETVDSSPAVAKFLPGATMGIVVGTGNYYPNTTDSNKVLALNTNCQLAWSTTLDGATESSPALADVLGNGQLQVVQGSDTGTGGSLWVLDAATGNPIWHVPVIGRVIGSVTTADLSGMGYQDVLVPTIHGVEVLDGRSGSEVAVLGKYWGFQNSPLVTENPNGTIGVTVAGYNGYNQGVIAHYEIASTNGSSVNQPGAWPMFHLDPQLNADASLPSLSPTCKIPAAALQGYHIVGSDGGVFSFGETPFCGSAGDLRLNAPIVGAASGGAAGGYWLVASDGGVFSFGGAQFFASMGGRPLNAPIVGIAATPSGNGYWLVASDGGVFSFGGAQFFGSMGGRPLNAPIVGIAANFDGLGYRIVARDGGVFSFGDARYFGSMGGRPLNAPIVGMVNSVSTGGYWLVASDGGVFSFGGAQFFGSMGGRPLNAPIVGIAAVANGRGYRLIASDGGIFCFGDAQFFGSMGGRPLNAPIVSAISS